MLFSPLASGSSGNATFVEAGGLRFLIDGGLSCRRLCQLLCAIEINPATIDGIFITHEQTDHIAGVPVFSKKYNVPVYLNEETYLAMEEKGYPIQPQNLRIIRPDLPFYVKSVRIHPFSTPHDAVRSMGYVLSCDQGRCGVMTDIGHVTDGMLDLLADCDILLLESNHDVDMLKSGPYPFHLKRRILSKTGHLSNDDCGLALIKLFGRGVRNVILGHLSKENNTPELALVTVRSILEENGLLEAMHVEVAKRDEPTGVFVIGTQG